MSTKSLTETVRQVVADELDIEPDFNLADSFVALGADSLDRSSLMLALEEALGVDLSGDDAEKLSTPQQVIDYSWNCFTAQP